MNTKEAARRARCIPRNIRYHCKLGHIPGATLLDGEWDIPEWAFENWLRQQEQRKAVAGNRHQGIIEI